MRSSKVPRFTQEKKNLEPDVRRMDEALDDLVWTLARRPDLAGDAERLLVIPESDDSPVRYSMSIR